MHLLKVTCYDEPEYLLLKENRVVARWSASEAWGAFVERLLERVVEEPIQTVDVTPVLQDLLERCNESLEVSLEALVESLIALYGLDGKPTATTVSRSAPTPIAKTPCARA